jgi:8-oxo-dGTP pyrophosphatase MutT (NUDIX family)
MKYIIKNTKTKYSEPEWGFPKGRRRIREDDVSCALREFTEETGFPANDVELIMSNETFEEVFFGTNHVLYRHIYYVGKMKYCGTQNIDVNKNNLNQVREVRAVRWFTYDEILQHIREHNIERKLLFKQITKRIESYDTNVSTCDGV